MKDIVIRISDLNKDYFINDLRQTTRHPNPFQSKKESHVFHALKDINLEIEKGEVIGIIGPNGAGKSTLLKLISEVTIPTSGNIEIQGSVASILEIGIGFQPDLTGFENIFLSGSLYGLTKNQIKKKTCEIIDMFGFPDFIHTAVKYYSSGMYMRLAFSIITHIDADIYLFDEVLNVGDLNFKNKGVSKIKELKNKGKTVLIITHAAQSLIKLFDRVLILDSGEIKFYGNPDLAIKIDYGLLTNNSKLVSKQINQINQNELLQKQNLFNIDFQSKLWLNFLKIYNSKTNDFLCTDYEIIIETIFHVNCKINFRMGVIIKDYNDNVIANCFSDEIDTIENKGEYNIKAIFPPNTFRSNFFMIDIVIVSMDSIIMSYTNALKFRLSSSDNQSSFEIFGYINPTVCFEIN